MLKAKKGGQTALIAFTKEPFVVAPLTEDAKTIVNLLKVLEPSIMPVQGHDVAIAMEKAKAMIEHTGSQKGQIVIITNELNSQAPIKLARDYKKRAIYTSVLGVGTLSGAPSVDVNGRLVKDNRNNVKMTNLDERGLRKLALAGGGIYEAVSVNNSDVDKLARFTVGSDTGSKSKLNAQLWRDEGHWFILLLLPFMLLVFRRGHL